MYKLILNKFNIKFMGEKERRYMVKESYGNFLKEFELVYKIFLVEYNRIKMISLIKFFIKQAYRFATPRAFLDDQIT